MKLGFIGLGKMGHNMVLRLVEKGYHIVAFDTNSDARKALRRAVAKLSPVKGKLVITDSIEELARHLKPPRTVWLMVPHGVVDMVLRELLRHLWRNDTVIDGGNSFYEDSVRRARAVIRKHMKFLDAGISGGPRGAREGACVMVGGNAGEYKKLLPLFRDVSHGTGYYAHFDGHGAGHLVKMVHNGIEYGMMQAIAEGFAIMKKSSYHPDLSRLADLYNHGSVIESHLVKWLHDGFREYGQNLSKVKGTVGATGEGEWTVKTAKKLGIPAPVIKEAFAFRVKSKKAPSYTGKLLSAMRNQFGGHSVK